MDEEEELLPEQPERSLQMYERRVTRVEETVQRITIEQQRQWLMIEKVTATLDAISNRVSTNELADVAIRERTEQHAKTIEHLQADQVDIGKLLNQHDNDIKQLKSFWGVVWDTAKWVMVTAGGLTAAYFFSHFIK